MMADALPAARDAAPDAAPRRHAVRAMLLLLPPPRRCRFMPCHFSLSDSADAIFADAAIFAACLRQPFRPLADYFRHCRHFAFTLSPLISSMPPPPPFSAVISFDYFEPFHAASYDDFISYASFQLSIFSLFHYFFDAIRR
jgi:hypothetical protein